MEVSVTGLRASKLQERKPSVYPHFQRPDSVKAPILPFLRSIDGLNTHDQAYNLTIAGGVTTALVLPGSANNIGQSVGRQARIRRAFSLDLHDVSFSFFSTGGQAFVIKPRQTAENTPSSMVVDAPWVIDEENGGMKRTGAIRHMKVRARSFFPLLSFTFSP